MPEVKLSPYPNGGTKTELDGVEVRDVIDIKLHFPVGERPKLTLQVYALEKKFEWKGTATVNIMPYNPLVLELASAMAVIHHDTDEDSGHTEPYKSCMHHLCRAVREAF